MGDSTGHEFQSLPDLRSSFASTLSYVQWQEKTGGGTRGRLWSLLVRVLHAERSESLAERKEDVLTCRRCSVETKMARRLSQHNESSSEETNLGLLCLYARLECRVDGRGQMWLTAKAHVSETLSNQIRSFRWTSAPTSGRDASTYVGCDGSEQISVDTNALRWQAEGACTSCSVAVKTSRSASLPCVCRLTMLPESTKQGGRK